MTIAFSLVATNCYFTLGLRFLSRFNRFYTGESKVKFFLFSDQDPRDYIPDSMDVTYIPFVHDDWLEATNSKPKLLLGLLEENQRNHSFDYLYHVDADTNMDKEFDEDWFIGDMVGFKHFMSGMKEEKIGQSDYGYDRNPKSSCYIPLDTPHPHEYYHACFYGGKVNNMMEMCKQLKKQQEYNDSIGYEAPVNDESHLNYYFHYNPPTKVVVPYEDFKFNFSCKGGVPEKSVWRNPDGELAKVVTEKHKSQIILMKNDHWNICDGEVVAE